MARGSTATEPEVEATDDGVETVEASTETTEKTAKAKKEPARGALPEGIVTPVGLATALSDAQYKDAEGNDVFYHTAKDGSHKVPPQMVYSYMRNASKTHPFPLIEGGTEDSIGKSRQTLKLQDGLDWWIAKNQRAGERATASAEKAAKAAEKAAQKAAGGESTDATETAVEAE
jgi:hypothetical protein